MTAVRLTMMVCALGLAAQAQFPFPGQYPPGGGYPGQYPPGQYPQGGGGGGGGIPGRQSRGRNSATTVPTTTYGMLRMVAGPQFVIESEDHRIITYRMAASTTVQRDGKNADIARFIPGDRLIVDSTEDDQGYYTATAVNFDKAGTPQDRAAAANTWDLPKLSGGRATSSVADASREPGDDRPILRRKQNDDSAANPADANSPPQQQQQGAQANPAPQSDPDTVADNRPATTMRPPDLPSDPGDSGPPTLKRGAAAADRPAPLPPFHVPGAAPAAPAAASNAPAPPKPPTVPFDEDPIITKARDASAQFAGQLPNFFCQQVTTRYASDHPKTGWDALDIVTADVAYENGQESYKNIKINNKPVNRAMEDIEGTRSTGEFASILDDLLNPYTAARFRKTGTDSIAGRSAYVYRFDVARENSHWRIESPAQLYYPAYGGSIWIDKQTARVLRIEQQARNMPALFPFDTVETATDYSFIHLSTPQEFLLPVDAEILSCVRGSSECARNKIEFRNYRKFGADSSIIYQGKQQD